MPAILKTNLASPKKTSVRRRTPPTHSGTSFKAIRSRFNLSQTLLARLLDVSLRTVSGMENGAVGSSPIQRNLQQISRLCEALAEAMQPAHVGTWMNQPNEMFDGLKPVEAIERGQLDLVWQAIEGLRSGSQL